MTTIVTLFCVILTLGCLFFVGICAGVCVGLRSGCQIYAPESHDELYGEGGTLRPTWFQNLLFRWLRP